MRRQLRINWVVAIILLLIMEWTVAYAGDDAYRMPQPDNPLGGGFGTAMDAVSTKVLPQWMVRTGMKKGIRNAVLDAERQAAPDAAILQSGEYGSWPSLLAQFNEPSVFIQPHAIAGSSRTKPYLIIPTSGLHGVQSEFIKASLREYVISGGVLVCFAQRQGIDLASLPTPSGKRLDAVGWEEDKNPLFRGSSVQGVHPALSATTMLLPNTSVNGWLTSYPENATILLARRDGYPTLISYPLGKGFVVVTTLFSEVSSAHGRLAADERTLLANLFAWAKAASRIESARPGDVYSSPMTIERNGIADATAAQFLILGAQGAALGSPHRGNLSPVSDQTWSTALSVQVPNDAAPGIYHIEYALVSASGEQVTPYVEASSGWFSISNQAPPLPMSRRDRPEKIISPIPKKVLPTNVPDAPITSVYTLDRASYAPGEKVTISFSGMESGELTVTALGRNATQMIERSGSITIALPKTLPAGVYRFHWKIIPMHGAIQEGDGELAIDGYRIRIASAVLEKSVEHQSGALQLRIDSPVKTDARVRLRIEGRDGSVLPVIEKKVVLAKGEQTVSAPISASIPSPGIWRFYADILLQLPPAPGVPSHPIAVASEQLFIDSGNTALLDLIAERAVYYEVAGPVTVTAVVVGEGKKQVTVQLDGKTERTELLETAPGITMKSWSLKAPEQGPHVIRIAAADEKSASSLDLPFVYGALLPDLTVEIAAGRQLDQELPIELVISNLGTSQSGHTNASLYDGIPEKGGKRIASYELEAIYPAGKARRTVNWPLAGSAGSHTLVAVVNEDRSVLESNITNNRAFLDQTISSMTLSIALDRNTLRADEIVPFALVSSNLTATTLDKAVFRIAVIGPRNTVISHETFTLEGFVSGSTRRFERIFNAGRMAIGEYRIEARLSVERYAPIATSVVATILPSLVVKGSFDEAPAQAVLCRPWQMTWRARSDGNIAVDEGTLTVAISSSSSGSAVYSRTIPFTESQQTVSFSKMVFHEGVYDMTLSSAVVNKDNDVRRQGILAMQPLQVVAPLTVERSPGDSPRVLVWLGKTPLLEQTVAEHIARQTFEQEGMYYHIASSAEEFRSALDEGLYNVFLLFDIDEQPVQLAQLANRVSIGDGLVVIGVNAPSVAAAAYFDIHYDALRNIDKGTLLAFTPGSEGGLAGNLPISGSITVPHQKNAVPVAVIAENGEPLILNEQYGEGHVMVLPFSFSRSAIDSGATPLYSLLLRAAISGVLHDSRNVGRIRGDVYSFSSRTGTVKTELKIHIPKGTEILTMSPAGVVENDTITYRLSVGETPQRVRNIYRLPRGISDGAVAEYSYECDNQFVAGGRVE